jgi:hypothetical protein
MKTLSVLLLSVLMTSCAALPATPNPGELATRVAATLAAFSPQAPTPPSIVATDTAPPAPTASATPTLPTETPTATSTPTATVSPTAVAGDPRTTLGDPVWRDRFTRTDNWTLGEDGFTDAEIDDERLILTGLGSSDGWRLTWPEVKDFYLEATFRTGTCSGNDHYGLMFRVPDRHAADEGYLLGLTCDGRFWLRQWDGENMDTIVPLTANAAIVEGSDKTNRLGVWADGETLRLYANGKLLDELTDDTLTDKGAYGVFVGARKTDDFKVYVSEIAYWDLP